MSKYSHKPRAGDKIWVEGRMPQPNGRIKRVFWEDQEVYVVYLKNNKGDRLVTDSFSFDDLWGNYYPEFMGGWYLIYQE